MKHIKLIVLISVALLIHGCALFQSPQERAEAGWETVTIASFEQMEPTIDPYLGVDAIGVLTLVESDVEPRVLVEQAWQSLKHGDYKQARFLLGQALYVDGEYKEAITLNNQISADLNVYAYKHGFDLMADKTVYLANEGDSLESISEQVYGTQDYFPFLMRLNTLLSSTLTQGDLVWTPKKEGKSKKVPKTAKPKVPAVTKKETPIVKKAKKVIEEEKVIEEKPISNTLENPPETIAKDLPELKEKDEPLNKGVEKANNQETNQEVNIEEVKPVKETVNIIQESAQIKDENALSEREVKGLSALRKGHRKEAYLLLLFATELSADGQKTLSDLKVELIDKPYSRGISNYQSQNLEQAIADFDQVLSVAPDHSQASLYRARCVRLLEKLKTIQ